MKTSRWYRYDKRGIKFVINCDLDKKPEPLKEDGYTEWRRGTGPVIEIQKKKRLKKTKY